VSNKKNKGIKNPEKAYIRDFKPKSEGQVEYIRAIAENILTICDGVAGTGKTACAVATACNALYLKEIKKIVITRPVVETGASMGYLPGTALEKVYEYMIPVISEIEDFFGEAKTEELLHYKTIDIVPLNYMRGRNLHECYLIVDEAQNCTYEQLKMAVTRIGRKSKCIMNGDSTQSDLYREDSRAFRNFYEKLAETNDVAIIRLHYQDIVRNSIIAHILEKI